MLRYNEKRNTLKLPNIVVRILAGAVFIGLLLGGILKDEYTFVIIFSLLTVLCLYEFYGLIEKSAKVRVIRPWNILGGFFLFLGGFYYCVHSASALAFVPYMIYLIVLFISELYMKRENPIQSLSHSLLGQVYIAGPLALTNYLVFAYEPGSYHYVYILALLVTIWVNDTFAYLTGMAFGKHRLFERISPKKSWEGFIGGAIAAIASSLIFAHFFPNLCTLSWLGFAAVVVVAGTWGDLFESLIKRTLGVKDSGNMIPGHGGILDRFDSTILAIPAVCVYLLLTDSLISCI
ncbi:phosphatidate cytidylyltransferase [Dysgonomonas termitidis]